MLQFPNYFFKCYELSHMEVRGEEEREMKNKTTSNCSALAHLGQTMVMVCERAVYPDEFYTVFLSSYLICLKFKTLC